jgi:hypothetical protein
MGARQFGKTIKEILMTTRSYKIGKGFFKAYYKNAGQGFEVGLFFNRKPIFVGNFIHKNEALRWWGLMNREIRTFTTRYWITNKTNFAWYSKFFSNHLYQQYYTHLDKWFNLHTNNFKRAFNKELKKYNRYKKTWNRSDRTTTKAA